MFPVFLVVIIFRIPVSVTLNSSEDTNLSNIIVGFYPYISILDIYNYSRYTTDDLVPLVSKVATKFTKILVWLDYTEVSLDQTLSSSLSGYAAAKYNCLNTTKSKVHILLGVITGDHCDCSLIQEISEAATKYADTTNELCNNTTANILLRGDNTNCASLFAKCGQVLNLTDRYNWGESISTSDYCNSETNWSTIRRPAIFVLNYIYTEDLFNLDTHNCKPFKENDIEEPIFIKTHEISDTNKDNLILMEDFITFWKNGTNDKTSSFLIYEAFDTFIWKEENILSPSFSGWWFLRNDPGTTNTSDFIFEEKYSVAARIDHEENPTYLPWYLNKIIDKKTSGIFFHHNLTTIATRKQFCRIISFSRPNDLVYVVDNALKLIDLCGDSFQLYLLINKVSQQDLLYLHKLKKDQLTLLLILNQNLLPRGYKESNYEMIQESGFNFGYSVDLTYCGQFTSTDIITKKMITDALADSQSSIVVFYYVEYQDRVNMGATRMFRLRSVLFESCKKLVLKYRTEFIEIGFAMKAFYMDDDFYESKWAMKNYLKYIDLMSSWVEKYNDTIGFLGSDEDRLIEDDYQRAWNTVGWYSYNDFVERKGYKSNFVVLLNTSTLSNRYLENVPYFGLHKHNFVLVICSVVVLSLVSFLALIYFIRRYRKYRSTYKESKIFFNGRPLESELESNDPYDVKYDKDKYEVGDEYFKVNPTEELGSGEFGKVCRGSIMVENIEIQVAVKTLNPRKQNRAMLKGLLSEIKILSYVGQHRNIIKLLGANTSSLKYGKIYVFLELCHLGSLKSFLQKLRTDLTSTINEMPETNKNYANTITSLIGNLDPSLSNDFYQWSKEICGGMEYLHEKHVVHADLSTRNVLLNLRQEVKICDFGLSRRMYNYENYVKAQQEPMPWRWMAPESLRNMLFNEKTDVWAFGITLWEIYSLGSLPYPGLNWDTNFVRMLEDGLVPSKPDFEEKNMYDLMKSCWKVLPDQRPTFAQISSALNISENL